MKVLGISDSHESHACVMIDGEIVSAISQERLSRLKADQGFPDLAINKALEIAGINAGEIDQVAFAGQRTTPYHSLYKIASLFSVRDWIAQCHKYWKPVLFEGKKITPFEDFENFKDLRGAAVREDPYYAFIDRTDTSEHQINYELFNTIRAEAVSNLLNINRNKIKFYRHEDCHKFYGLYSCPQVLDQALILTVEGGGDDSSATYSEYKSGVLTEKWASNFVNLGRLYRYVTLILGMKPAQHEYKVMGLAPYGNEYHGKRALEFFNTLSTVKGTQILPTNVVKDLYFSVRDALEGERFDGIAWGLQEHLQIILQKWIENCISESGIRTVVLSGGVGQNIKACKHVVDNVDLDYFWAGPICGDGSLGLGAAYLAHSMQNEQPSAVNLNTIYLGSEYSNEDIKSCVSSFKFDESIKVDTGNTEDLLAEMIANGKVCARFSGRMEFGQRALGNRSILANPSHFDTIEKINTKVKFRDFWMPFTPSMTNEFAESILQNRKSLYSPYMTIAFDLIEGISGKIPAVIHPSDKTTRPQMLKESDNPSYYRLLKKIGALTGCECVLNTSFNLHGEAIVETPKQAIETFLNSGLDALIFDKIAILRVRNS